MRDRGYDFLSFGAELTTFGLPLKARTPRNRQGFGGAPVKGVPSVKEFLRHVKSYSSTVTFSQAQELRESECRLKILQNARSGILREENEEDFPRCFSGEYTPP